MSIIRTDDDGTSYADLTIYAPAFIAAMQHFSEMYKAAGYEDGTLWSNISSLSDQANVSTATAALALWAAVYGATISGDDEETRLNIIDRMQVAQTCTPELIKQAALELTGIEPEITEYFSEYTFAVIFDCVGEPDGIDAFIRRLELIKPAHLAYTLEYTAEPQLDGGAGLSGNVTCTYYVCMANDYDIEASDITGGESGAAVSCTITLVTSDSE